MSQPADYPITITQGIEFGPVHFDFKDDQDKPFPLAGWRVYSDVRVKPGRPVSFSLGLVISDTVAGRVTLPKKTDEETEQYPAGHYEQWALVLEDPDGNRKKPYVIGPVTVEYKP